MISTKNLSLIGFLALILFFLTSCQTIKNLPGGDAREFPADPELRLKKNLEEGRGFRLSDIGKTQGGVFDFASSNELWRASLDVIDFMPLSSVNYSGGIIITDWYSKNESPDESIKISIRFLTNEIRSDALEIKIFTRKCIDSSINCKIASTDKVLVTELKKQILKKAVIYEKEKKDKDFKPYKNKGFGIE